MKIVGLVQFYNEGANGNLERCMKSLKSFCEDIVCYDDGSTDNSLDVAKQFTDNIIINKKRDWRNELSHKNAMLQMALKLKPDWLFWLDADEEVAADADIKMQAMAGEQLNVDGWAFNEVNLWKSNTWYRVDTEFGNGWFVRLWRNNGKLNYTIREGLHLTPFPNGLNKLAQSEMKVIHYGFNTVEKIVDKYKEYLKHDLTHAYLNRIINEGQLIVRPVKKEWFSNDFNYENRPEPMEMLVWMRLIG